MRFVETNDNLIFTADNQVFKVSRAMVSSFLGESNPIVKADKALIAFDYSESMIRTLVEYMREFRTVYLDGVESDALKLILTLKQEIQNEYDRCQLIYDRRVSLWNHLHARKVEAPVQESFWNLIIGDLMYDIEDRSPYSIIGSKRLDELLDKTVFWNTWSKRLNPSQASEFCLTGLIDVHNYFGRAMAFEVPKEIISQYRCKYDERRSYAAQWRRDQGLYQQILIREAHKKWCEKMINVHCDLRRTHKKMEDKVRVVKNSFDIWKRMTDLGRKA